MTILATLLPIVVVVPFCWLLDRRDERHQDDRNRLLTLIHTEREAMAVRAHDERIAVENARAAATPDLTALVALVEKMAQRIQAPEAAVVQHQMEAGPVFAPPAVLPDDDAGWFEARMTKEDLAERMAAEELEAHGAH